MYGVPGESANGSAGTPAEQRASLELPDEVMELLAKRLSAAVFATVGEDGVPLTTIVNHIAARDRGTLAIALPRGHPALANLRREPRVAVALADEGDVAASVRGRAEVARDSMSAAPSMALVTVSVVSVRDDSLPDCIVCQGIRTRQRGGVVDLTGRNIAAELRSQACARGAVGGFGEAKGTDPPVVE